MSDLQPERRIALFQRREIRRVIHNKEWWFVITDVVAALTDSVDPTGYVKDMRRRDAELSKGWGQIATPLSVPTAGGPQKLDCANTEGTVFAATQTESDHQPKLSFTEAINEKGGTTQKIKTMNAFSGSLDVKLLRLILLSLAFGLIAGCATSERQGHYSLGHALTFHASFDHGLDADFAAGDAQLRHAPSLGKQAEAKPGLPESGEVQLARDAGRFGHALRFTKKKSPMPFFRALKNVPYRTNDWSGTVSFWLSTDPAGELEPGFCDPIQITPRAWNDACFFVEFEKRTNDIPFRLGVYPDTKVWNPSNKKWADVTATEKPLSTAPTTPFARGKWTHIVFTWEHFNTGRDDGIAKLYLDGTAAATIGPRRQTFTWHEGKCLIALGLSYIGLWDELAVFNRPLTAEEVRQLHGLKNGVRDFRPAK